MDKDNKKKSGLPSNDDLDYYENLSPDDFDDEENESVSDLDDYEDDED